MTGCWHLIIVEDGPVSRQHRGPAVQPEPARPGPASQQSYTSRGNDRQLVNRRSLTPHELVSVHSELVAGRRGSRPQRVQRPSPGEPQVARSRVRGSGEHTVATGAAAGSFALAWLLISRVPGVARIP